jgi:hypothetical protein
MPKYLHHNCEAGTFGNQHFTGRPCNLSVDAVNPIIGFNNRNIDLCTHALGHTNPHPRADFTLVSTLAPPSPSCPPSRPPSRPPSCPPLRPPSCPPSVHPRVHPVSTLAFTLTPTRAPLTLPVLTLTFALSCSISPTHLMARAPTVLRPTACGAAGEPCPPRAGLLPLPARTTSRCLKPEPPYHCVHWITLPLPIQVHSPTHQAHESEGESTPSLSCVIPTNQRMNSHPRP